MAKHHILDSTGHSTIEFDGANKAQLVEAMGRFTALIAGGHTAAVRKADEADYKVTKTFDPTADETLFIPQLIGG